jgi:hypothetical protein
MFNTRANRRKLERKVLRGKILTYKEKRQIFNYFKYLHQGQADSLYETLIKKSPVLIEGNTLPNSYSQLRKPAFFTADNNFLAEIEWYGKTFIRNANKINEFLILEKSFEEKFLKGEYVDAWEVIQQVEASVCVCQWTIDKKLLLGEYMGGFERNKEVLSTIVHPENDGLTNILANCQSIKIEKNVSFARYEELIKSFARKYEPLAVEYLTFKLNYFSKHKYSNKGWILNVDGASAIIDRYITFITLILQTLSDKEAELKELDGIRSVVSLLISTIKDVRLNNILWALGVESEFEPSSSEMEFIHLLDLYTIGDYKQCLISTTNFLIKNPTYFDAYEIYVKSIINIKESFKNPFEETSVAGRALNNIYIIISKNNDIVDALIDSYRIFRSMDKSSWAFKYFVFFNNEHSVSIPAFSYATFSFLCSPYINPIINQFFNSEFKGKKYIAKLESKVLNSPTIHFWKIILYEEEINELSTEKKINPFRKEIYLIKVLIIKNNLKEALNRYQRLLANGKFSSEVVLPHYFGEIVLGQFACLIGLRRIEPAIELLAKSLIERPNFINKFRFNFIIQQIISMGQENLTKNIYVPILLHQYGASENEIWIAYDNFLASYNLNYPHEIGKIQAKFNREALLYFLKNLCKQEIYYSSTLFENQDELDNERIEICLLLLDLDEANKDEYHLEIGEISRVLLIRQGIKQIDESKIYVDEKGLKISVEKDLKDLFTRSLQIKNIPINQIDKLEKNISSVVVSFVDTRSSESNRIEDNLDNFYITSYSRFIQFEQMFLMIRDKFIASNEFGIDTYLSMRIRHGTLVGEIRSGFENHQLVTKKDSSSGKYQENVYWLERFEFLDDQNRNEFNRILSEFSSLIDEVSEDLRNRYLQVQTEKKQTEGLFDYSYTKNELLFLFQDKYGSITDYDEFITTVLDDLWYRTENNLRVVREYITHTFKNKIIEHTHNLQQNLKYLFIKDFQHDAGEIFSKITLCQTFFTIALEKVSQWFQRTKSKNINDFLLNLSIDASLSTVRRIYPNFTYFSPHIQDKSKTIFEGEYLASFSDIFQIIFTNIIEHSQLPNENLVVKIRIDETDNVLTISIENSVSRKVDLADRNKRIKDVRNLLKESHDVETIRKEGGTGYLKIKKILKGDLSRKDIKITIEDIGDDYTFRSEIIFETNYLQKV